MRETWPEGVIKVTEERAVREHEEGWYWVWREREDKVPQSCRPYIKSQSCYFYDSEIYQKLDANSIELPLRPVCKRELEPGLYIINKHTIREKKCDGASYIRGGNKMANNFDSEYSTYELITGFEKVEKP